VAYGNEIADDLVADVSPSLEYFLGCWPILVADLAGAENMPAAPASFDVLDAFEQLAALARGSRAFPPYAAASSSALAGMSPPPRRFGWHSVAKRPPATSTICRLSWFAFFRIGWLAQGARREEGVAPSGSEGDHSGQRGDLAELDRVGVLERVEVDDHATLALRDLFRGGSRASHPSWGRAGCVRASCRSASSIRDLPRHRRRRSHTRQRHNHRSAVPPA
jgi:hypothetical protein